MLLTAEVVFWTSAALAAYTLVVFPALTWLRARLLSRPIVTGEATPSLSVVIACYSEERLVDELIISFTHTTRIDWMLPGLEPTGKRVEVVFVVIVGIEDGKVSYEHINWDQANVLVQLGLIDPTGLPLVGAGAAAKLRDPSLADPFFG